MLSCVLWVIRHAIEQLVAGSRHMNMMHTRLPAGTDYKTALYKGLDVTEHKRTKIQVQRHHI